MGSLFFVLESKAVYKSESFESRDADIVFEFLQNLFGEFLTADFILRKVLALSYQIYLLKQHEQLKAVLEEQLTKADGFPSDWFTSLMYTPLFSRPAILDMMREWLKHILLQRKWNEKDFLEGLDVIISNQLKLLLNKNTFPSIMRESGKVPYGELPLVGYLAIYSLNLILLRTVLSSDGYTFDEELIPPSIDGARTWDRLTYLWRSWFSLESLYAMTAILITKQEGFKIYLKAKNTFTPSSSKNRPDFLPYERGGMRVADNPQVITSRRLRVFLCHASGDKPVVRTLYSRLKNANVDPWLDEENILLGLDWDQEIRKAVRMSDVVIVCLTHAAISKTGYVQKEIKFALDVADEQPEGTIFLIPFKLEECDIPGRLRHLQGVNYFQERGFDKLLRALQHRADTLAIKVMPIAVHPNEFDDTLKQGEPQFGTKEWYNIQLERNFNEMPD